MTLQFLIIINLLAILFNVTNAFIDAYKIKVLNKVIRHGINLGAYLIWLVALKFIFHVPLPIFYVFFAAGFFNRQITFDIPLNLRRGLKWFYVSLDRPPKAVMDRIEVFIFGYNGKLPVYIYGSIWSILLVVQAIVFYKSYYY